VDELRIVKYLIGKKKEGVKIELNFYWIRRYCYLTYTAECMECSE